MSPSRRQALIGAALLAVPLTLGTAFQVARAADDPPRDVVFFSGQAVASDEPGVVVCNVVADSPAAKAGVARGDIVLKVNDSAVNTFLDLNAAVKDRHAGDQLALALRHGDDSRTLTVTLAEQDGRPYVGLMPCGPALPLPLEGAAGATVAIRTGGPMTALALPDGVTQGAVLFQVLDDGPAKPAGLKDGDVVTAVDGTTLDDPQGLAKAVAAHKPGDSISLTVYSSGAKDPRTVAVTLGNHPDKNGTAYLGVRTGWIVVKRIDEASGDVTVAVPATKVQVQVAAPADPSAPLPPPPPVGERI